jgi:hypothetical protein
MSRTVFGDDSRVTSLGYGAGSEVGDDWVGGDEADRVTTLWRWGRRPSRNARIAREPAPDQVASCYLSYQAVLEHP